MLVAYPRVLYNSKQTEIFTDAQALQYFAIQIIRIIHSALLLWILS